MPPRLSEAEIEKLRVLYEGSPLSVLALIRETGHSHRTVYYYASRRGWKSRAARRGPRLPIEEIRALYEDTIVPVAEIARIAGVAVPTIHVWAVRHGWKPRASRLRGEGAGRGGEIADLRAEVAAARRRAEAMEEARERETEVRITINLLRAVKYLHEAEQRKKKAGQTNRMKSAPEPDRDPEDIEAARRDLARKIEAVIARRDAERGQT